MSDADKQVLEKIKVEVEVEPASRNNLTDRQVAQKASQRLKTAIESVLNDPANRKSGSNTQFRVADKVIEDERDQVPKKNVRRIKVTITGERQDVHGKMERVVRVREVVAAG